MKPPLESSGSAAHEKNERDFFRIVTFSTALALGVMAAFLYSIRDWRRDASLDFSFGTVVAFVLGAGAGWAFWKFVRRQMARRGDKGL